MLSQAQLSQLLSLLPTPAFLLNSRGECLQRYGIGADSNNANSFLPKPSLNEVFCAEKAAWLRSQIHLALAANTPRDIDFSVSCHDLRSPSNHTANVRWFNAHLQALDFSIHGEAAVLMLLHDVSDYHQRHHPLSENDIDLVSHLYSQRQMVKELQAHFSLYNRHHSPCSLVLFELDYFNQIQAQCGESVCDSTVELVGSICASAIRQEDRAFRYHQNGFVILMPYTDTEHAWGLIDRLRKSLHQQLLQMDLPQVCTSISGGLSQFHRNDQRYNQVLLRADHGLLHAKELGRNRICSERFH